MIIYLKFRDVEGLERGVIVGSNFGALGLRFLLIMAVASVRHHGRSGTIEQNNIFFEKIQVLVQLPRWITWITNHPGTYGMDS